jgi:hypothetical protein
MAFSSTLTIADEVNASSTFAENFRQGTRAERINIATSLSEPTSMVISHNTGKQGTVVVDRHLVQFTKTALLADDITPVTTIVNLSITVPRGSTAGDPDELVGYLINFIIGTNTARTLANLDEVLTNQS